MMLYDRHVVVGDRDPSGLLEDAAGVSLKLLLPAWLRKIMIPVMPSR